MSVSVIFYIFLHARYILDNVMKHHWIPILHIVRFCMKTFYQITIDNRGTLFKSIIAVLYSILESMYAITYVIDYTLLRVVPISLFGFCFLSLVQVLKSANCNSVFEMFDILIPANRPCLSLSLSFSLSPPLFISVSLFSLFGKRK